MFTPRPAAAWGLCRENIWFTRGRGYRTGSGGQETQGNGEKCPSMGAQVLPEKKICNRKTELKRTLQYKAIYTVSQKQDTVTDQYLCNGQKLLLCYYADYF